MQFDKSQLMNVNFSQVDAIWGSSELPRPLMTSKNLGEFLTNYRLTFSPDLSTIEIPLAAMGIFHNIVADGNYLAEELHQRKWVDPKRFGEIFGNDRRQDSQVLQGRVQITGLVPGSSNSTAVEHKAAGLNNVPPKLLAIAHLAFFLETREDYFQGQFVRAESMTFYYNTDRRSFDALLNDGGKDHPRISASKLTILGRDRFRNSLRENT